MYQLPFPILPEVTIHRSVSSLNKDNSQWFIVALAVKFQRVHMILPTLLQYAAYCEGPFQIHQKYMFVVFFMSVVQGNSCVDLEHSLLTLTAFTKQQQHIGCKFISHRAKQEELEVLRESLYPVCLCWQEIVLQLSLPETRYEQPTMTVSLKQLQQPVTIHG